MKQNTAENVERVGRAFHKELTEWFKDDGVNPTPEHIENSNDYYDANMAMDAAFRSCGLVPDVSTDDSTDLWNAAWERAIAIAKGVA